MFYNTVGHILHVTSDIGTVALGNTFTFWFARDLGDQPVRLLRLISPIRTWVQPEAAQSGGGA